MIDPMVSLAFAVYSNKGAYALLLGSGISRASGIPTGWEVVLDLIRKVATLEGEDCEPDPEAWFRKKHGSEAEYSNLLDAIAKSPTERQQLLRGYFEPTEDERGQGLKLPSAAHKAIAKLVAAGFLRVIITTNFDKLTEKALEEEGVAPTVISTTDQLTGALPLVHSGATVIKLHGDYLDTRIKNTATELATYDPEVNKLLDRVLDEYGLIVCGWSGEWDTALRQAIERCLSRRFSTFWTATTELSEQAVSLAQNRKAEILKIQGADSFFPSLLEKVTALADISAPHPLSAKIAVATVKKYLVDPAFRIRLRDLVHDETEQLYGELRNLDFCAGMDGNAVKPIGDQARTYEALTETLQAILVTGCYWGDQEHAKLWVGVMERIAQSPTNARGSYFPLFPALFIFYSAGLAAIAAENYEVLAVLLTKPVLQVNDESRPLVQFLYPSKIANQNSAQCLPGMDRHHTPMSDYLHERLPSSLKDFLLDEKNFDRAFNRLEYLISLVFCDLRLKAGGRVWGPLGRFGWQGCYGGQKPICVIFDEEIAVQGSEWPPLRAGLFDGSIERLKEVKTAFDTFLGTLNWF